MGDNNRIGVYDMADLKNEMQGWTKSYQYAIRDSIWNIPNLQDILRNVQPTQKLIKASEAITALGGDYRASEYVSTPYRLHFCVSTKSHTLFSFHIEPRFCAPATFRERWRGCVTDSSANEGIILEDNYPETVEKLCLWAEQYGREERRARAASSGVESFCSAINTPGQWKRVWPEIVPFLKPDMRRVIENQQRKSRVDPSLFEIFDENWRKETTSVLMQGKLIKDSLEATNDEDNPPSCSLLPVFHATNKEAISRYLGRDAFPDRNELI